MEQVKTVSKERFLPEQFDFFHLGRVEKTSGTNIVPEVPPFIVLFKISGDEPANCAVAFSRAIADPEEQSMVTEIANILASKFVSQIADSTGVELQLSPPETIDPEEKRYRSLASLVFNAKAPHAVIRAYVYRHEAYRLGLKLVYIPSLGGNA